MNEKREIIEALKKSYPDAKCELNYKTDFELLVAVILSAQCTDKRVNEVTKVLFERYDKADDFAKMSEEDLERYIYPCGFYHSKAKNIIETSKILAKEYCGVVPSDFETLVKLPGVGRKTANVLCAELFNIPSIAVDTHVFRTSKRLGLAEGKTPFEVEMGLRKVLDESEYVKMHHTLIFHGRYTCKSQRPLCESCGLYGLCKYKDKIKIKTK